jgi:protein-tyrosine-phosphatase
MTTMKWLLNVKTINVKLLRSHLHTRHSIKKIIALMVTNEGIKHRHKQTKVQVLITEDMIRNATVIVNMGCMDKESCPMLFIHDLLEWGIEDPKGKSIEKFGTK